MAVAQKIAVAKAKNQSNPKTIGIKNETSEPMAAPIESAAYTPSGFSAAASNNAGKDKLGEQIGPGASSTDRNAVFPGETLLSHAVDGVGV